MKKNILTIIIMALSLINTVLIAVLIFTILPTAIKTNALITKVASIVDLELESPNPEDQVTVDDIENYKIEDPVTCSLASSDGSDHYVKVEVTLQENKKNEKFVDLKDKVDPNVSILVGFVQDVFSQYTKEEVKKSETKDKIKKEILAKIQEYFDSDFIINVTFSNLLIE